MTTPKTTSPVRPSPREVAVLLEHIDKKYLEAITRAAAGSTFFNPGPYDEPMPTSLVLKLATIDWMEANKVFAGPMDNLRALLAVKEDLERFGSVYEKHEAMDYRFLPTATFSVLDYRYIVMTGSIQLFDMQDNVHVDSLPYQHLSAVTCNLTVLLVRLFDKMERTRNLQEVTHAVDRNEQAKRKRPRPRK